jgi:HEAT repeat protein
VCASIVGDAHQPGMIRRQALQLLLLHLDGARSGEAAARSPTRLAEIAQGLGELLAYPALRPLERLYEEGAPLVRRGVMKALQRLYFKRTFNLIGRGLRDAAPEVRDTAIEALEALHFPHAFDPLTRIFREHADHAVKVTALTSIGRIATVEAGEFLIDVLRHESEGLREVARQLLAQFEHREAIYPLLRRHLEMENGPARVALEQLVRSYGLHAVAG